MFRNRCKSRSKIPLHTAQANKSVLIIKKTLCDISDSNGTINKKVRIFNRKQWLAQPPISPVSDLPKLPVSLVIIQHSATESCLSQSQCIFQTRYIQMFHIESMGWNDIAYNFLVGGDGDAYEGRGWKKEGKAFKVHLYLP
nr:unnamed protein product [Callosobruchus chinensis]